MLKMRKNIKGFTFLELIIVMALLLIIASMAIVRYNGVLRETKINADYVTAVTIAKAVYFYSSANYIVDSSSVTIHQLQEANLVVATDGIIKLQSKVNKIFTIEDGGNGNINITDGEDWILYPRW